MGTLLVPPEKVAPIADRAWLAMPDTLGRRLSGGAYTAPPHVRLVSWLLMLNGLGVIRRLGISLPPGHSKSETIDVWYPTWLLEHDSRRRIILASYSTSFAEEWGKRTRAEIEANPDLLTLRLDTSSRAADRWRTQTQAGIPGGGMWTAGLNGGITGRRASHFIVDDIVKNWEEATREDSLNRTWDWFQSVVRTRLLPRASAVVLMTRWADGDLIGRLQAQQAAPDSSKLWVFCKLPALAVQDETLATVIGQEAVDKLTAAGIDLFPWSRQAGQALWPELEPGVPWFDEIELAEIRGEVGEVVFNGLYQQEPTMLTGDLFKIEDWKRLDALPAGKLTFIRRWDIAATEGGGDWTAGALLAMDAQRTVYIVDVRRCRRDPLGVERFVHETAVEDRDRFGDQMRVIRVEREPGSSGKMVETAWMRTVLSGFHAEFLSATGSKRIRALPFSAQQKAGNVYMVRTTDSLGNPTSPDWFDWFPKEAAAFTGDQSGHDDAIDAACAAYVDLIELGPRKRPAKLSSARTRQIMGG
jgi:predicted phage terminase large subunit-like protein